MFFCFFFFQAEDGIRDGTVTGVQTCALPICRQRGEQDERGGQGEGCQGGRDQGRVRRPDRPPAEAEGRAGGSPQEEVTRSEERRVGKECRSRGSTED